jgi:ubiquinone/menaquinone biosynthesis C-methylase UbiE
MNAGPGFSGFGSFAWGNVAHRICPWWLGYVLVNPVRRLYQNPRAILAPHVRPGMTVVEAGPGMGFFTLDIARLVGPSGRVVPIDVQPKMLSALRRRAKRARLLERIETRLVPPDKTGMEDLEGRTDFILAFAVLHELPDQERFFAAASRALRAGGRLLAAEPKGHVTPDGFTRTLESAARAGLAVVARPSIRGSLAALLEKSAAE